MKCPYKTDSETYTETNFDDASYKEFNKTFFGDCEGCECPFYRDFGKKGGKCIRVANEGNFKL